MQLSELFSQWIRPYVHKIYNSDPVEVDTAEQEITDVLTAGGVDPDDAQALQLMMAYYALQRVLFEKDRPRYHAVYAEALRQFTEPPAGQLSSLIQRRFLLQLRILAHYQGIERLNREDFHELLDRLPPDERHTEQWHFLTTFAFQQGDARCIAEAYEVFLNYRYPRNTQFLWRRLEVMHKLLGHRATKLDLALLIEAAADEQDLNEIRIILWPAFEEQDLVDDHTSQLMLRQQAEKTRVRPA